MNKVESGHPTRYFAWGALALLIFLGVVFFLSAFFIGPRPYVGTYYPFFPFFGFRLIWGIFGFFFLFWIFRWVFWGWGWGWGWRGRYGRYYDSAYYALRERYARGEITKEQFEQIIRDLEQHS